MCVCRNDCDNLTDRIPTGMEAVTALRPWARPDTTQSERALHDKNQKRTTDVLQPVRCPFPNIRLSVGLEDFLFVELIMQENFPVVLSFF